MLLCAFGEWAWLIVVVAVIVLVNGEDIQRQFQRSNRLEYR